MKKLILSVLPILAFAMTACQRNNGKTSSETSSTDTTSSVVEESSSAGDSSGGVSTTSVDTSSGGTEHKGSTDPITTGYAVKVGNYYYALEAYTPGTGDGDAGCWKNEDVEATEGEEVVFYNDGVEFGFFSNGESLTSKNNVKECPGPSDPLASAHIYSSNDTASIYLHKWKNSDEDPSNDTYSFWVTGFASKGTVTISLDIDYDTGMGYGLYAAASFNGNAFDEDSRLAYADVGGVPHQQGSFPLDVGKNVFINLVKADYEGGGHPDWNNRLYGLFEITEARTLTNSDFSNY